MPPAAQPKTDGLLSLTWFRRSPMKGASMPPEILKRIDAAKQGQAELQFFPSVQPRMMPYLASQDQFGNTAARPGALFPLMPVEPLVQGAKYWLSDHGFRYSL